MVQKDKEVAQGPTDKWKETCVIPQVHKRNENELHYSKIVTTLKSAGNSISQQIQSSVKESRSGAFLMTIFGEMQWTAG